MDYDIIGSVIGGDASDDETIGTSIALDEYGIATITGTTGYDNHEDEQDCYRFEVSHSGLIKIDLTDLTGNLYIRLIDWNQRLLENTSANDNEDKTIEHYVIAEHTYTLVVDPYYEGESPYQLLIDAPPDGEHDYRDFISGEIIYGGDAGNQIEEITPVDLAENLVTVTGSTGFNGDEYDWFEFEVPEEINHLSVGLSTLTADLTNFSAQISAGQIGESYTLPAEEIIYPFTGGETFYLAIEPANEAATNYQFYLDISTLPQLVGADDTINGITVTGSDATDQIERANQINLDDGDVTVSGSIASNNDLIDYYQVFLPESAGSGMLNLTHFNAAFSIESDGTFIEIPHQIHNFTFNGGESYNIAVEPTATGVTDYSFTLAATETAASDIVNGITVAGGDASHRFSEPEIVNFSTSGNANVQGSTGFSSDEGDCYKITATTDSLMEIAVTGLDEQLSVQLFDDDGNGLASSNVNTIADQSISYSVEADQSYIVIVASFLGSASAYQLGFDFA